ncbi:uncharacterized protein LOC101856212 [Aplysia californica]|uniref:Uncharacterized protein LOC101856212 n=1 Tax=Aplysia californica TaxID=6500 RepID=A0ABM0K337_APLCA|nr:uncharacterized protein LOC101856212 [Aplysia californica]
MLPVRHLTWCMRKHIRLLGVNRQNIALTKDLPVFSSFKSCFLPPTSDFSTNHSSCEEHADVARDAVDSSLPQKLWKRMRKGDPALKELIQFPNTQSKISQLADILDCDESLATELVKRNSPLLVCSEVVFQKIKLIKSYGFSAADIISNPSVLHRTYEVLDSRFQRLKEIGLLNSVSLRALKEPDSIFEAYFERRAEASKLLEGFASPTDFLSEQLNCDLTTMEELMRTNKFLCSISLVLVKNKMDVIRRCGLSPDVVRDNLGILQHTSVPELERRLQLLQGKNFQSSERNPGINHLLTCSIGDFSRAYKLLSERQDALEGCRDKAHYLQLRLGCSELEAGRMKSSSLLNRMSEMKLRKMLDFFLNEVQVPSEFVVQHKRLMTYSESRLRHRWQVLRDAGEADVSSLAGKLDLPESQFEKLYGGDS